MIELREMIEEFTSDYIQLNDEEYINIDTGEIISKEEFSAFKKEIALEYTNIRAQEAAMLGISLDIYIGKTKPPKKKSKPECSFRNGAYNMFYRVSQDKLHEKIKDPYALLIFYELAMKIKFPYNYVSMNDDVPTYTELCKILNVGIRKFQQCIKLLEEEKIIRIVQVQHRKRIYVNPEYCASGTAIDKKTLKMFNLIETDTE